MSMKKVLAFGLAATMVFSLAACGSSSSSPEESEEVASTVDYEEIVEELKVAFSEATGLENPYFATYDNGYDGMSVDVYKDEDSYQQGGDALEQYTIYSNGSISDGDYFIELDNFTVRDEVLAALSGSGSSSEGGPESSTSGDYVLTAYTYTQDLGDGYTCEWTVNIGGWVKASDTDAMNAAWQAVGGEGDAPTAESFDFKAFDFNTETAIMVYGTASVVDTTPGDFSIATSSKSLKLAIDSNQEKYNVSYPVNYAVSYAGELNYNRDTYGGNDSTCVYIKPGMKSKNWGPVPFVLCVGNAFTPEYPDGRQEIFDTAWRVGDTVFYVSSTWQ